MAKRLRFEYVFDVRTRELLGEYFSEGKYSCGQGYVRYKYNGCDLGQIHSEYAIVTPSLNPIWTEEGTQAN